LPQGSAALLREVTMRVGLFLDVDKTITRNFIQSDFAKALGCEREYSDLEDQFQRKILTATAFGEKIIDLFASKNFNARMANEIHKQIPLQPWAEELLKLSVDKYLVSSGPSYFIDELARRHKIPEHHVCRSEYLFNAKTEVIEKCNSIDEQQKAQFVKDHLSKYDITIGIGDHPEFDGPFVSLCTLPFLTVNSEKYIYVPSFGLVIIIIKNIVKLEQAAVPLDLRKMTLGPSLTVRFTK
jgi:phosphoserine phosphatase